MTEDAPADQDRFERDFAERIDGVNEGLREFEVKVELAEPDVAARFRDVVARLQEDRAALAEAAQSVAGAAAEAWRDLAAAAERALERLEEALSTAWADFSAETARDVESFKEASGEQLESWRGYVDKLRVHAKLAQMELREALADLDTAFEAARPQLEQAKVSAEDTWQQIKRGAIDLVGHMRDAARTVSSEMRSKPTEAEQEDR